MEGMQEMEDSIAAPDCRAQAECQVWDCLPRRASDRVAPLDQTPVRLLRPLRMGPCPSLLQQI